MTTTAKTTKARKPASLRMLEHDMEVALKRADKRAAKKASPKKASPKKATGQHGPYRPLLVKRPPTAAELRRAFETDEPGTRHYVVDAMTEKGEYVYALSAATARAARVLVKEYVQRVEGLPEPEVLTVTRETTK